MRSKRELIRAMSHRVKCWLAMKTDSQNNREIKPSILDDFVICKICRTPMLTVVNLENKSIDENKYKKLVCTAKNCQLHNISEVEALDIILFEAGQLLSRLRILKDKDWVFGKSRDLLAHELDEINENMCGVDSVIDLWRVESAKSDLEFDVVEAQAKLDYFYEKRRQLLRGWREYTQSLNDQWQVDTLQLLLRFCGWDATAWLESQRVTAPYLVRGVFEFLFEPGGMTFETAGAPSPDDARLTRFFVRDLQLNPWARSFLQAADQARFAHEKLSTAGA